MTPEDHTEDLLEQGAGLLDQSRRLIEELDAQLNPTEGTPG